jgi:hypothetical protein
MQITTDSPAELRDLQAWLLREHEFRGRVRLLQQAPMPGSLGALAEALEVALGPGGALTALAGAVIVWLRGRSGSLTVKLSRDGESVELSAKGVRGLGPAEIRALVAETAGALGEADPHVLGPGLAPTPFTAEEIRAGCPAGRTIRLLVEDEGAEPYERFSRFVSCDETGATIERGTGDGTASGRATWADMQAHAAFPAAATTIEPDTIEIPLGTLACQRYTVRDGDDVTTFWFAAAYPGMPVRVVDQHAGRITSTTTMISSAVVPA